LIRRSSISATISVILSFSLRALALFIAATLPRR
jgi:hypothetical protein